MKQKLILIRGLGHSGSTILDLILGAHSSIIGIGEGIRTLRGTIKKDTMPQKIRSEEGHKIPCTCGKIVKDCGIWGNTIQYLISNDSKNLNEKFSYLSERIYEEYGNDKLIVDSSQSDWESITHLNEKYDIKILFLTRDIRSWVNSVTKKYNGNIIKNIWTWNSTYMRLENFLIKNKLDFFKLGYEELALETDLILQKIIEWLDLKYDKEILNILKSKSHIIAGNRMRLDKNKRSKIIYDFNWMLNDKINYKSIFFLPFLKRNNKFVYSNIKKNKT
jgi:hypothetical protein